jgi:hypothetical protein
MTIYEIESTLASLRSRHPGLDEAMLTTLLLAAGWDDRSRNDTLAVFRGRSAVVAQKNVELFPPVQLEPVLPIAIETDHLLLSHNPETEVVTVTPIIVEKIPVVEHAEEPQSLIVPSVRPMFPKEEVEPPENLPLRPFETTPHVWSFAQYKDIFHGDVMPQKEVKVVEKPPIVVPVFVPVAAPHTNSIPLDKKDESLVALASVCLLVILLLLGYMYSNGRI